MKELVGDKTIGNENGNGNVNPKTNTNSCPEFQALLEEIGELGYCLNTLTDKAHEANVEAVIKKHGFREQSVKDANNDKAGYWYIKQPNGSQQPPDFRVGFEDKTMDIECKSCKTGYKPMWNASFPESNTIYVFTNKRNNETILFTGDQIVTPEVKAIYEKYKRLNKELHKQINQELNALPTTANPYRMNVYARNMFVQTRHLNPQHKSKNIVRIISKLFKK
ncbi:MAG: hypothetical protein EBU90_08005 [Proteobacteria bacterium]|nr:hypothetical protein [Pseudomonadota bacterium]NBP15102.1 hypothetical protein [bacterium]